MGKNETVYLGICKGWYDFCSPAEQQKFRKMAGEAGAKKGERVKFSFYNGTQVYCEFEGD